MTTRFLMLGLLTAATPWLASAQTVSAGVSEEATNTGNRQFVVQGTANPACIVRTPTILTQNNAQVTVRDVGSVDIRLDGADFIDATTGVPKAVTIALGLPVTCNTAHHITIQSARGGLSRNQSAASTAGQGDFRSHIDFTVELDWGGTSKRFDTAQARSLDASINNAATGVAALKLSIPGGGTPLVAGDYNDIITVKVEAAS